MGVMLNLNDCSSAIHILRDNPHSILFVTSQLRPRELKMAHGLRQHGWSVGLVYYKWTPFDPASFFDFSIEVGSPHEAHAVAKQLSPRITHVFSGAIDDFVMLFCRDKPSPVVIDLNDVFAPSLFDYCHERFEPTREALALADGFCARDLQVKSAERSDGFKLPKHLILFPEYCWQPAPQKNSMMPTDEVHIVSVGTFSLETQGMYDSCYLQMAKLLVEQEIHFHIYPHWAYRRDHAGSPHANFERDFADFLALERTTPYLHLHDSLPLDELARVLPQYDFGIVSGGCAELGQKLGFYYPAYLETCYSGRISDYLEARLPVLVNDEVRFDYWLLKRYGVCVDLKELLRPGYKKKLIEIKNDQQHQVKMERAVDELSVTKNAPRLVKFYTEVLGIPEQESINITTAPVFDVGAVTLVANVMPKPSSANSTPAPDSVLAPTSSVIKRAESALRNGIRWLSPRAAKIILPYRAIRMFEVRLHNALIELETNRQRIASQQKQVDDLRVGEIALQQQFENAVRNEAMRATELQQRDLALEENKLALMVLNEELESLRNREVVLLKKLGDASQNEEVLHAEVQQRDLALEENKLALMAFSDELESLRNREVALLKKLGDASQNEEVLHAELQQRDLALEENKLALMALNEELESLQNREVVLLKNLGDASQNEEVLHAEVQQRDLALEENKLALMAFSDELESLRNREVVLLKKLGDASQNEEVLHAEVQQRDFALESNRQVLAGLSDEVKELKQQVHLLEIERKNLLDLSSEKAALELMQVKLNARIESLDLVHRQDEAWVASLQQDKNQLVGLIKSAEHAHEATRVEFVRIATMNETLEMQSSKLHEQLVQFADDKSVAQIRGLELERDKAIVEHQLAEQNKVVGELRSQVIALGEDKSELRRRVSEFELVDSALRQQLIAVEQDKEHLLATGNALRQELQQYVEISESEKLKTTAKHMASRIVDAVHATDTNFALDTTPKLLIACMPKSGSTWLNSILEKKLGLPTQRCYLEADRNEQEIDPIALFQVWGQRTLFVQQHIRYSRVSMQLFNAFSTKIVVLTRRLEDIVISLRDHIENESPEWSMFFMEADWYREMKTAQRIDFIIDHAMPWYLNFYLGWRHAAELHPQRILHVSYEDLARDSVTCVHRIASFYGVKLDELTSDDLDLREGTRFNQGKIGRGKEELSQAQQARLRQLALHYRHSDFTSIGL